MPPTTIRPSASCVCNDASFEWVTVIEAGGARLVSVPVLVVLVRKFGALRDQIGQAARDYSRRTRPPPPKDDDRLST